MLIKTVTETESDISFCSLVSIKAVYRISHHVFTVQCPLSFQTRKSHFFYESVSAESSPDLQLLQRAQACCRGILQAVNEVVRETEHRHRLSQYQRRLDLAPLERQANPVAAQFKVHALSVSPILKILSFH